MARVDRPDDTGRATRLVGNSDGQWTARDVDAEVTAQGETRNEALAALDDVVAVLSGEAGHEPTTEEPHELGVNPDVAREQGALLDILK